MSIKRHIPNIITLGNLFCGCIAVFFVLQEHVYIGCIFAIFGIVLDFFDGFAARLLKVQSELGLQLDSMADLITSGMFPGALMFHLIKHSTEVSPFLPSTLPTYDLIDWLPLLGFLITLGAGYRLAVFNLDTRQTTSFIGLPTPANALLIISLIFINQESEAIWLVNLTKSIWFLIPFTLFSVFLMNMNLPLMGLKFKTFKVKENKLKYLFFILSILLLTIFKYEGLLYTILLYIMLSLLDSRKTSV